WPASVIARFAGLRSRCTMPLSCAACSASDLPRDGQRFLHSERASAERSQLVGDGVAIDELEDEKLQGIRLLEPVNGSDVRMVDSGEQLGFALETGDAIRIGDERVRKNLDGDGAIQLRITSAVDLAHPAGAQWCADFVHAEAGTPCGHTAPPSGYTPGVLSASRRFG